MNVPLRWLFAGVAVLAMLAGGVLWFANRAAPRMVAPTPAPTPAVLYAVSFKDTRGNPQSLGRFQGKPVVLNFWATWCAPCREEMPAFVRLQRRAGDTVRFVGVAMDDPAKVERFAADLGIDYPLWVGGEEVGELSRRLGNSTGALPFTALLDARGQVVEVKVGAYSEAELASKIGQLSRS